MIDKKQKNQIRSLSMNISNAETQSRFMQNKIIGEENAYSNSYKIPMV